MAQPKMFSFKSTGTGNDGIKTVWHDGTTLRVSYRNGGTYDYEDVSDELLEGLVQSSARAKFMIDRIRPGREVIPVVLGTPFPRLAWD